jgi:two-component system, OmpR family, sensor histidine kinase KdpD
VSADARPQETASRGRLRIYLGYAPGAGTTCALLREGHQRASRGADVVVAHAQTHCRPHTQALLAGLEIIARAPFPRLGAVAAELDLGAVLARRPQVALVDELARRDLPGAGHAHRWQDVQALLASGIDVISTVSIGHLESLADAAEKITRVPPAQTVPDPVVRTAAEIELVDAAPQELRRRMAAGHIYPPPEANAALAGWFCTPNLSALRELALLWLASTLGGPQRHSPAGAAREDAHAREKVVVAVGAGPEGQTLIRRAARIAARSGADLLAVHAAQPGRPGAADRAALTAQRTLTESLGGSWHQLAGDDVPAAVLAFAHAEDATQLVLGAARHTRLRALPPRPATAQRVIRRADGLDVHLVTCTPSASGIPAAAWQPNQRRRTAMTEQNTSWPGRMRPAAEPARRRPPPSQARHPRRLRWLASAAAAAAALAVVACGSSAGSVSTPSHAAAPASGMAASGSTLKTTTINGVTVLTNAKGFTLYSFGPDTPAKSNCNDTCAELAAGARAGDGTRDHGEVRHDQAR